MTLDDALKWALGRGLTRLDAQLLLLHALGQPGDRRAWLIGHGDLALPAQAHEQFVQLAHRRLNDEPLAYITGRREFHGLELHVDARVLDPRADTETLVDWALGLDLPARARVADLGTGSGAVALSLKAARPLWQVTATDASEQALTVAAANARRLGLDLDLRLGHWCEPLQGDSGYDLILSNPPYIALGDPHLWALRHEPSTALVSGPDGLDAIGQIANQAVEHMLPGGWLLLEHGHDQHPAVAALLRACGYSEISSRTDISAITRCTGARRPLDR